MDILENSRIFVPFYTHKYRIRIRKLARLSPSQSTNLMAIEAENRFGLKRRIPEPIKIQIRKNAGYGCVRCGNIFYEYHHHNPPFASAHTHDPMGITLLCHRCHGQLNKGFLKPADFAPFIASPWPLRQGFSCGNFGFGSHANPRIEIGPVTAESTSVVLEIETFTLLEIEPPEEPNTPFRLTAFFTASDGSLTTAIVRNEVKICADNWDVNVERGGIKVRSGPRQIALAIQRVDHQTIRVTRLKMEFLGFVVRCTDHDFSIISPAKTRFIANRLDISQSESLFSVDAEGMRIGTGINRFRFKGSFL